MKKGLLVFSGVLILALCSCGSNEQKETPYDPSAITSIVEKKIPYYSVYAFENSSASSDGEKKYDITTSKFGSRRIYTVNNETIPYVSVSDFVSNYIKIPDLGQNGVVGVVYEISFSNNVLKATNSISQAHFEFDTIERKVTYYDFDNFFSLSSKQDDKFYGALYGSDILDDKRITYEYYPGKTELSFSLADYSIKDYVYQNNVLLPYETLCVLFNQNAITSTDTYMGNGFYSSTATSDEKGIAINEYLRGLGTEWISQEYLLNSYNNLALAFDMFYGLDERQSRVENGKVISYMTDGAYSVLAPYKQRLLSTELNVSNNAMCELLKKEFDDGGHTSYSFSNILSNQVKTRIEESGPESANTLNTISGIQAARKEKGTDAGSVFPKRIYSNGYYKESDKTAYIQFDSFTMTKESKADYIAMGINEENYMSDSISLFYYANEKIQNNPNIKNVIIDLSANGGGTVYAGEYIASWINGGSVGTYRNPKTNCFMKYRVEADVNFDGNFNAKDYLSPDINVYLIVSNGSFSCANKTACNVKDNRTKNTYIIGSRSGGGSCVIKNIPFTYLGGVIRVSTNLQIGRNNATQEHFVSNEGGVEADYLKLENTDYTTFADVDAMISKINNAN